MTPYEMQVLDAMLRQNGGVPVGMPTSPPNFTMPGAGPQFNPNILSGEGVISPVSGNVPAVMQARPIANVVGQASGPIIDQAPSEAAAALGGTAEGMATAAEPTVAAAAPGLLSKIGAGMKMMRPFAGPIGLAMAALSNDPTKLDETNNGKGSDPLAKALNPSGSDTGIMDIGKGVVRGAAKAGETINDFFTKTKDEKAAGAVKKAPASDPTSPQAGGPQPTIEQALGLEPIGGASKVGTSIAAPGRGRNPVLDALEGNMMKTAPGGYHGGSPDMQKEMVDMAEADAMSKDPGMWAGLRAANSRIAAGKGADLQYKTTQAALALAAQERQSKWAIDAATVGEKLEAENQKEQDASMKIHASKGHFLIESTQVGEDGKPQKVLQPLDDAYFGVGRGANGGIDPKASVTVMGQKFANLDKDPFAKQAMLLGNIQKDGQLSDVMNDKSIAPLMQQADLEGLRSVTGLGEDAKPETVRTAALSLPKAAVAKAQVDARRGVLFNLMVRNPDFQQKLINMQVALHQATKTPMGPRLDTPAEPVILQRDGGDSPDAGDDDFLSQLEAAKAGEGK